MFIMTHDKICHVLATGQKVTYGNLVVDYQPQKEDPHRICITAGSNFITYASSPSIRTAELDTEKLHWNSVISTKGANYMCLDIKKIYLTAKLEYFEYMRMPLELFPIWVQEQYNLKMLAFKGFMHLEIRMAVWGLPQAAILTKKTSDVNLPCLDILSMSVLQGYGITSLGLFLSLWWLMNLG
jgi:hypothetical protein